MSPVTLYHNPNCSTSRNALALLRERGIEPVVVEYLKTPPSRDELKAIADATGEPLRALLRTRQAEYAEQGLDNPALTDDRPSSQGGSAASGSQPAGTSAPSVNTSAPRERLVTICAKRRASS